MGSTEWGMQGGSPLEVQGAKPGVSALEISAPLVLGTGRARPREAPVLRRDEDTSQVIENRLKDRSPDSTNGACEGWRIQEQSRCCLWTSGIAELT